MRSRNGNRPFIFTTLAVIATIAFGADNYYYIGYRLTSKNTQPINETLSVSKAMQSCHPFNPSESITLQRFTNESLQTLLSRNPTPFLEFAAANEFHIKSNASFKLQNTQTLNALTLPTKCYAVEFNDDSVTITSTK